MGAAMTPERWRQVDRVLQEAMALEAEPRAAYLDEACAGDEPLRQEVEALLAFCGSSAPAAARCRSLIGETWARPGAHAIRSSHRSCRETSGLHLQYASELTKGV